MAYGFKTGGREKGTPNKINAEIREKYKELLENNLSNIDEWLQKVAKKNPDKALHFLMRLSEFIIPKLQSTDLTTNLNFDNMSDMDLNKLIDRINNDEQGT